MINKISVLLSSNIADLMVSLAGNSLTDAEKDDLYQSIFDYYLALLKHYDSATIQTMSDNFDKIVW